MFPFINKPKPSTPNYAELLPAIGVATRFAAHGGSRRQTFLAAPLGAPRRNPVDGRPIGAFPGV